MSTKSPLDRMIDAAVKCLCCGAQGVGTCDCWPGKWCPKKCGKCERHCTGQHHKRPARAVSE